jgi:hypothetical protein
LTLEGKNMSATVFNFTGAVLDPRITFTRVGNTATRVDEFGVIANVNANIARFNYNPTTLTCLGLLIEEAKTNVITYSADLTNAIWSKTAITASGDSTSSPDGTVNADTLIETTAFSLHFTSNGTFTPLANTAYTASCYFKNFSSNRYAQFAFNGGAFPSAARKARFDLVNGTTVLVEAGVTATITPAGGGWYRCTMTQTSIAAPAAGYILAISLYNPVAGEGYTGDGTSGVYVWGAQLELGSTATSYIPTVASTVTRNADVATITGTNFSDFWQVGKGGASVLATPLTVSGIRPLVQFDDGTSDNIIALRGNVANPELQVVDVGAPQVQLDAGTIVANTPYSLTGWWQTNDCKARQNSGATVSDYTATIPTVTQARIGSDGTNYLNGTLATINYYDSFFGRPIYTRRKNKVFPSLL